MNVEQVTVKTQEEAAEVIRGWQAKAKGRVGISGTLTYKDKDGNVVGTTDITGSVPLHTQE
jgi:uncharacterized lipoprotein YehR (DUF1307 family)